MIIKKLSDSIRQFGFLDGCLHILSRVLFSLSNGHVRFIRYHFMVQPIPPMGTPGMRPNPKNFVGITDATDPLVESFPRSPAIIEKRFKDGNICIAAKVGEKFAGYLWLASHHYDESEVRCRYRLTPPSECVWDFDVFVEPEFRYGRTFARLWDSANTYLAQKGVRWTFSQISSLNVGSLHSHGRLGSRKICSASFLCLGNLQITLASTSPYVHISVSSRNLPTLVFSPGMLTKRFFEHDTVSTNKTE